MNTQPIIPATSSTLSEKELGNFIIDQYQLGKDFHCKLFRTGMNHTYFISNKETKYVVRVYSHNWRSKTEILEEIKLLNLLKDSGVSISFPIPDKNKEFLQEVKAPEGNRHVVLFSFAKGEKIRFLDKETCFDIGVLMAKFHHLTTDKTIQRISYTKESLLKTPYKRLQQFFSEELPEMKFFKEIGTFFKETDFEKTQKGIVHLDIWYDNMAITDQQEVTIFDFDFCGNGALVLDVGYFCNQLFQIEADKKEYEQKKEAFLNGYQSIKPLIATELELIPKAGLAVFVFYLGIQAQRFDWSNVFLSENYLKLVYLPRLTSWMKYHDIK